RTWHLPLLHRALVFAQGLLLHRHDPWDSVAIYRDLEVDRHRAIDPFAPVRILHVVIVLEAGGITVILRFLAQPNVAPNRGAARWPSGIVVLTVAPHCVS